MPEAAIVLPFSILVTITVVLTLMFFYEVSISQCHMHMALRCDAGNETGTVRYESELGEAITGSRYKGEITCLGHDFNKRYEASANIYMRKFGLLYRPGSTHLTGSCHCVSGRKVVRLCNLLKPGGDGDESEE